MLNKTVSEKRKKAAQHVVELALMMPLFIILFSFTFQIMVETFSKYRFSYIFTNAVRTAIQMQPVYDKIPSQAYDFINEIDSSVKRALVGERTPFSDVQTGTINTNTNTYLIGAFQFVAKRLFFGESGKEYFYFIVPVSTAFCEPLVLNKTTHEVESYFEWYFTLYAKKYYESANTDTSTNPDETNPDEGEGGEGEEGNGNDNTEEDGNGEDNSEDSNENGDSGSNEDAGEEAPEGIPAVLRG